MHRKINWVFFDLDGTLADSISAMYTVYLNFLQDFDVKGTREEFEELNGSSLPEIVSALRMKYKLSESQDWLVELYKKGISAAYKDNIKPTDGAEDVLRALKEKQYKLLLVTSAASETALGFIKRQKWEGYFENYVFGDEVKAAKPSSEIYELALRKANVSSDSVAIVEDSRNGIQSARGTGACVIGLAKNQKKDELLKAGADRAVFHLMDILKILDSHYEEY